MGIMKKYKLFALITVCLLLCMSMMSCKANKQQFTKYSMDYFDTVITVVGFENTKEEFDRKADEILSLLAEYHKLYTIYHRYDGMENLCTVNELADGVRHRTVKVDRRIADMLVFARDMYDFTDGRVNVAMGSVLSLWHDYRSLGMDDPSKASLPPMEKLVDSSMHTDINDIIIDIENCTVTLTDPEMKLDVGAIAKGYAAQRVADYMEETGMTGYVLNVGGNVCTIGTKPDGSKWTVGLENPDGGEYLAYLGLSDKSVVTSGSYQRFYYVDGKKYHHIIDPDTLMPAEGFVAVSIICDDAGIGDALSTALFCMPIAKGIDLIESIPGTEAMWVSEDGVRTFSSGWNNYVKK